MPDAQDVPVFMRHVDDAEPRFLGRFPLADLGDLVDAVRAHGCFHGEGVTEHVQTQYICYQIDPDNKRWITGFEVIVGDDGDDE